MSGQGRRADREAQAAVLMAVLLAGEEGLTEVDLEERCEGLGDVGVEGAVEALLGSGLLDRIEARLHASGAATRFERLRPL